MFMWILSVVKRNTSHAQTNKTSVGATHNAPSQSLDVSTDNDKANINVKHFPLSKFSTQGEHKKNTDANNPRTDVNKRKANTNSAERRKDELHFNEDVVVQVTSSNAVRRQREASIKKKTDVGFYMTQREAKEADTLREYTEPEAEETDCDRKTEDSSKEAANREKKRK
ncbi:hypothetical protein Ddc_05210 [Ditylenchus destructor]|nr:hypothetical protein Ddc_05210 [Ditylenchus destructor]